MRRRHQDRAAIGKGRPTKRTRVRTALALIAAGVVLIFGPALAIDVRDAYLAHVRDAATARWMATHLAHAPVRVGRGERGTPSGMGVIAPGPDGYLLEIPLLHLRVVVHMLEPVALTGVPTPILTRYGLGQIPYTTDLRNVSPGGVGTAAIAGHRTTHGAPFRHLDLLKPGDFILVRKGTQEQQWRVTATRVIAPADIDAIRSHPGARRLVLLSCTPPFSAKSRLMIVAEPAGSAPFLADASTRRTAQPAANTPATGTSATTAPAISTSATTTPATAPAPRTDVPRAAAAAPAHPTAPPAAHVAASHVPPRRFAPAPAGRSRNSVMRAAPRRTTGGAGSRTSPLTAAPANPYRPGMLWQVGTVGHEADKSAGESQHERGDR